jgi:outer membrane protein OmpA-like peptidoglycan-associated protein
MRRIGHFLTLVLAIALGATASFAQDGKLKVKVTPKQAYVFLDGKAIKEGNQTITTSAGKHTVVVVNYGYKIETRDVNVDAGKTTSVDVALTPYGGNVSGPWGAVKFINGDERAAVLSNGKTPAYFVGHVDEFNWDWIWQQELLLPPGKHHLTVTRGGNNIWDGDVTIVANQKVVVDLGKSGAQATKKWDRGEKMKDIPRFKVGIASATIAVAPVSGTFNASSTQINCAQSSNLTWQTAETVDAKISGVGAVATSGSQSVSPHATTTYDFNATGPGGTVTGSATVNVNTKVDASLTANPSEVKYRKIGDKVITQDSSTLTWTTSNANSVSLDGKKVDASGNQTVQPAPQDTSTVPEGQPIVTVDETKTYTLNATNVCGGSSTQTAALHITGSREPIPQVLLQSVFYPTDYPDKKHPQVGLVKSQQLELATLAAGFKKYLEYDADAKLSVEAFADVRGSKNFNQDLSERRVERIKQYLVDQGVAADKVQTAAYGKERPLDKKVTKELEETNPSKAPKARAKNHEGYWLAYNRRADIILLPSGKKSSQYYPNGADDSGIIWQIPKPPLSKVEKAQ